jgi:acyl-CoA synthetase (AMP-forming)/AMP-acid ligase II
LSPSRRFPSSSFDRLLLAVPGCQVLDVSSFRVLADVARATAGAFPDKPAFVMAQRSISFAGVNVRMNRLANGLAARGLRPGDRVAVLSRNRPEFVEVCGASKGGFAVLPLNWRLTQDELQYPLTDGQPKAVIADSEFAPRLEALRPALPFVGHYICFDQPPAGWESYEALLAAASPSEPSVDVAPADLLCLMYTSGTTGRPKGVELTHGGLIRNAQTTANALLSLKEDDIVLVVMPLFHVGGMWYHAFPAYARGCTSIVLPEFTPAGVLSAIERYGITVAHLVPTMISALVNDPALAKADLSSLRLMYYAGSSISEELLRKAMAALPGCGFVQSYGSTEGGVITALSEDDHRDALARPDRARRLLTSGRALQCEVKVIDAAPDGIGEIVVRGDRTMQGYWRNPAATEQAFASGWFRTGDLGRVDTEGYVTIADRKHDMIVSGGENVYPREVEDALARDPDILEVAVFGLPDPHWVEKVTAAVVLRPGSSATETDLLQRVRAKLAGYKCPKQIFLRDGLPKNGAGKILRGELKRIYGAGLQ